MGETAFQSQFPLLLMSSPAQWDPQSRRLAIRNGGRAKAPQNIEDRLWLQLWGKVLKVVARKRFENH